MTTTTQILTGERATLLDALSTQRANLLTTVRGLTTEQAASRPTVSELCLGGLLKHLAQAETRWVAFIERGPEVLRFDEAAIDEHHDGFRMRDGETLASVVADYERVAAHTDDLIATLPDLDVGHDLPPAPWFGADTHWTARRVFVHLLAETAQHSGHADILRETIDGQKTM